MAQSNATDFVNRYFEVTDCKVFQEGVAKFHERNEECRKAIVEVRDELGAELAVERNGLVYGFTFKDGKPPEDKRTYFKQKTEYLEGKTVYCLGRVNRRAKALSDQLKDNRYSSPDDILESVNLKGWMMFFAGRVRSVGMWGVGDRFVIRVPETDSTAVNENNNYSSENEKYVPVEGMVELKASEFCAVFEEQGQTVPTYG